MTDISPVRVAAVQASACPFDTNRAVEMVCSMTAEAAKEGSRLILFPEAYVGGYPWGLAFGTAVGGRSEVGRSVFGRYWESAIDVPGPEVERMCQVAGDFGVWLCVGVIERDSTYSTGTLFCTLLYFGPNGELLGKHRKLKPTAAERLIWGEGDGSTLTTVETDFGRVGGLICWENYMPLARMTMYGKGVKIYPLRLRIPVIGGSRLYSTSRWRVGALCSVVISTLRAHMYPKDPAIADEPDVWPKTLSAGGTAIYGPLGEVLGEPLWNQAGIVYADLDMSLIHRSRFDFDVTGHYARPDVFRLIVDESPKHPFE